MSLKSALAASQGTPVVMIAIEYDPFARGWRVGGGDRGVEMASRHLVGTQPEIEEAELQVHARQILIVEQHRQVQYLHTQSSLPNFRTHDFVVSGGPTVRF